MKTKISKYLFLTIVVFVSFLTLNNTVFADHGVPAATYAQCDTNSTLNLCDSDLDCPPDVDSGGNQAYTCEYVRDISLGGGDYCSARQCYSDGGGGSSWLGLVDNLDCNTGNLTLTWDNNQDLWEYSFAYPIFVQNTDTGWNMTHQYSTSHSNGLDVITDATISVTYNLSNEDAAGFDSSNSEYYVDIDPFKFYVWTIGVTAGHVYPPEPDEISATETYSEANWEDFRYYQCGPGSVDCPAGYDQCGVCGGDGSSCITDCAGVVGGTSEVDVCGECTTPPIETDTLQCNPSWVITATPGTCDATTITLSWSDPAGEQTEFKIDRTGGSTAFTTATTTAISTSYIDDLSISDPVFDGTETYTYTVTPVYLGGDGTSASATSSAPLQKDVCGTCGGTETDSLQCNNDPGNPFTLTTTPGSCESGLIDLSWDEASGDQQGYVVERLKGSSTATTTLASPLSATSTSYQDDLNVSDSGFTGGQTYTYIVTPTYIGGNGTSATSSASAPSSCLVITSLDPGACDSQTIDIAWGDIVGEDGYNVKRDGTTIEGPTSPDVTSHIDDFSVGSFSPGTSYSYTVEYFDSEGVTSTSLATSTVSALACSSVNNCDTTTHGTTQLSKPTANLCSVGTDSGVTANATTKNWEWSCADATTSSDCSASVTLGCGTAIGTPTDTEPTTNLCITGNSTSTAVTDTGDQWLWTCRNDSAYSLDTVEVERQCDVENTNGVFISGFNLDPRIVADSADDCTANYTITSSNVASTTCAIENNLGTSILDPVTFTSGVATSTSTDIDPGFSYRISCVYDDGVEPAILKETEYQSCNLNPQFFGF